MPGTGNRPKPRSARRPSARPRRLSEKPRSDETQTVGLPASLLTSIHLAGLLHPEHRGAGSGYSPRDLHVIDIARALHEARISAPKIVAALGKLQKLLPEAGDIEATSELPTVLDY